MNTAGFLVGRFQTAELTEGHKKVLNDFLNQNFVSYNIIFGVPVTKATKNNPLDFDSRRRMIEDEFPNRFKFYYIKDEHNDFIWSNNLDEIINKALSFMKFVDNVILYGSRTNFISKYFGQFETKELEENIINSTNFQKDFTCKKVNDPASWRAGACWATENAYPVAYHTVDCAIFTDLSFTKCWMAKKAGESKLRFVGGFIDPIQDNSAEEAARREAREETSMYCDVLGYISSRKIYDWRYEKEQDKIITSFYALINKTNTPKASDDIAELYKVDILTIDKENVQPEHRDLLKDVQNWVRTKQIYKEHKI